MNHQRLTRVQAIALYDSEFWRFLNAEERACFQLTEERLCMPFPVFHEAVEICLERPVAPGEYLWPARLLSEIKSDAPALRIEHILEILPPGERPLLAA